ncbi:MAG: nuclear transport factor 2 family protein [Chloroflexi bacterium]|jgi:ketosteroid isomerase-like protein|nr:nuclear transport factor 2 family protein [Chloroflexota bacterium]
MRSTVRSLVSLALAGGLAAACGAAATTTPAPATPTPSPVPTVAPTSTPVPTPVPTVTPAAQATLGVPPTAAAVTADAAAFDAVAAHFADAWSAGDPETMRGLYTEDVHLSSGSMEWDGIEAMVELAGGQLEAATGFRVAIVDTYLGSGGGLVVDEATYSANDPLIDLELHVFTTRGDRIATWELLIDPARTHDFRFTEVDVALLDAYVTAWSSGDPEAVAALYAESSTREDALFVDSAAGPAAIAAAGARLFGRSGSPTARWELLQGFAEPGRSTTAGLFAIKGSGPDGKACEVRAGVVLESADGAITRERIWYEPASLVACGWVQ